MIKRLGLTLMLVLSLWANLPVYAVDPHQVNNCLPELATWQQMQIGAEYEAWQPVPTEHWHNLFNLTGNPVEWLSYSPSGDIEAELGGFVAGFNGVDRDNTHFRAMLWLVAQDDTYLLTLYYDLWYPDYWLLFITTVTSYGTDAQGNHLGYHPAVFWYETTAQRYKVPCVFRVYKDDLTLLEERG